MMNNEEGISERSAAADGRPKVEVVKLKNGETKEVKLVYNTKDTFDDTKPIQQYKTAMCKFYPNCPKGMDCHFAHSKEELDEHKAIRDVCIEYAQMSKVSRMEHHELCTNQQCPVRLCLLLKKTILCRFNENEECKKTDSTCTYAHGEGDIKPLPKYEYCQKYKNKLCHLPNTECVYAHSEDELRSFGAVQVRPVQEDNPVLCEPCQYLKDNVPADVWQQHSSFA